MASPFLGIVSFETFLYICSRNRNIMNVLDIRMFSFKIKKDEKSEDV